ncbi:pickpocket protein 28-like [Anthonomus grandis grandis]|uniref:pickpocket protein 28-like n=1 Tax=Anthonomus grandis grandis TaxID=2921223 RepID=UPI0021667104|nr:pickpocket protein 28-like [Anthonomus grandis grandis]
MSDPNMTAAERIWWFILFCLSLNICIFLIIQSYVKWDNAPALVSFAKTSMSIWDVPFPAVTVCSETKAKQTAYNYTEYYHRKLSAEYSLTDDEFQKYADLSLVCPTHFYDGGDKFINYDTIDFLMSIAPQFNEMFWSCNPFIDPCSNFFTPILTERGLCYTFNMLDRSEIYEENVYIHGNFMSHDKKSDGWTIEDGYSSDSFSYPRRALSPEFNSGLTLLLRAYKTDLDFVCNPVQGFKVILHNPAETPNVNLQYIRAPLNQEILLTIKPDLISTSTDLRGYTPDVRQCYFSTERKLMFFRTYTQHNCEIECLANYTLKRCGCVSYSMPHEKETPMCGPESLRCAVSAKRELRMKAVGFSIDYTTVKNKNVPLTDSDFQDCNCLPDCTSLGYKVEISQAEFMWPELFNAFKVNQTEFSNIALTKITLIFKEQQFLKSDRNFLYELYGMVDFFANCGGILGLFTGFSFLSMVEILYFLSLKLICNVRRFGLHNWSG